MIVLFIGLAFIPVSIGEHSIMREKTEISGFPICNIKYFFFCRVNSSGHATFAKEKPFLGARMVDVMYYEEGGNWIYGVANIQAIFSFILFSQDHLQFLPNYDCDMVLSIYAWGFKGETSWKGAVGETDVWLDGFALVVQVAYHGYDNIHDSEGVIR